MNDVMSDLETLATSADAVILSIGAVKFNKDKIGEHFYAVIDIDDSLRYGRRINQSTLQWWFDQERAAIDACFNAPKKEKFADALMRLSNFFDHDSYFLWGNGASFDNAILEHAYAQIGEQAPWKFYNSRCFRTIKKLAPHVSGPAQFNGVKHNALDDAIDQTLHLQLIWEDLTRKGLRI